MVARNNAISRAKSFIEECTKSGINFKKVLLFGSYADNKAHKWSDIDLLMISDQFTDNIFDNLDLFSKINIHYPEIEVHPYSTKHFTDGDDFINEILKKSIELV